ncbi:MAG: HlyC/CorC family transporter [Clostridia bacterium]|nr:HlyC/CorC family transporter [Clostridia bacterium]
MTTFILQLLLQAFLILLNAIFACAEIAILSVNKTKMSAAAEKGDKKAVRLTKLTDQPERFLATIQVAITLSGFLGSAFAADNFASLLVDQALRWGWNINPAVLNSIAVVVVTLILSYFTLVLGELVPKRIAMKKAEGLALGLATPLSFISKLFAPVVWFLSVSTNVVLRMFGIDPNQNEEEVSEEDIRLMVDTGHQSGAIDTEEQEFIQNVFDFDDTAVAEFATHRTDVDILDVEDTAEQWEALITETRHSHYPVCEGTPDQLLGILDVHDYYALKDRSIENIRKNALKPPYFIPESLGADVLFRKMKKDHSKIAVVLDEYGGFFGIVTIFDLVEQLVGELEETENEEAIQQEEDIWEVSGLLPLKEAQELFGMELPTEEYDTFGGFVFSIYGSIPDDGETFELETHSLHITVNHIAEHRIEKATVRVIREEAEEESEEKGLFKKNKEKSED